MRRLRRPLHAAALAALGASAALAACVVGTLPWVAPGVRLLYRADGPGRSGIRFLVAQEENEIALTRGSGDASPVYDPGGGWVVYASQEGGSWDLWRVRLSGLERAPITRTPGVNERFPAFSPDGETLYFTSDAEGTDQLWRSAPDGSGAVALTSGPPHSRAAPDSAGARLAALEGEPGSGRLVWVELPGGSVTPMPGGESALGRPAVRSDGVIAFACAGAGVSDLCVLAERETPRRVTEGPAEDRDPVWSPDGSRIVFSSNREDGNFELYLARADGSDVARLTEERGTDGEPAWVP